MVPVVAALLLWKSRSEYSLVFAHVSIFVGVRNMWVRALLWKEGGGGKIIWMHSFFRIGELRLAVQQDLSSGQPSIFLVCRSVHLLLQPFIRPFLWPKGHVSLWPW